MRRHDNGVPVRGGTMRIPRSRGATSGFLLILLGAWGALIPFIGPYLNFAWGTNQEWAWTAARGWLEVLPGAATVVGGLLLLGSGHRAAAMLGGWITVVAGAWFLVGRPLSGVLKIGDVGRPLASTEAKFAALDLAYFTGLGTVIVFLGALALGRLSVRSLRDIEYVHGPLTTAADPAAVAAPVTQTAEPAAMPRYVSEPRTERVADQGVPVHEEPPRRGLRGMFRRHRETSTAAR
ncbi:MAG: hypothetical protein ACXVX7_00620 [Mycobacterium sp.]